MFRITHRSRLIAGLAATVAVALVPAAASSAAEVPPTKALDAAAIPGRAAPAAEQDRSRKASAKQTRKATQKLNRAAKRAGLVPTTNEVGRGYFASNGYGCFYAPAWNYTICFRFTGYGSGNYAIFEWGDSAGRSGYAYLVTLDVFLYSIGG